MSALVGASPCRIAREGRRHTCSAEHAELVRGYRDARQAAEQARESVTYGYATETAEHAPILTFKDYLRGMRGTPRPPHDVVPNVHRDPMPPAIAVGDAVTYHGDPYTVISQGFTGQSYTLQAPDGTTTLAHRITLRKA